MKLPGARGADPRTKLLDDPNGYDPRQVRLGFYCALPIVGHHVHYVEVEVPAPLGSTEHLNLNVTDWYQLNALGMAQFRRKHPILVRLRGWRLGTWQYVAEPNIVQIKVTPPNKWGLESYIAEAILPSVIALLDIWKEQAEKP